MFQTFQTNTRSGTRYDTWKSWHGYPKFTIYWRNWGVFFLVVVSKKNICWPVFGEDFQFDSFFQMGWNHQVYTCFSFPASMLDFQSCVYIWYILWLYKRKNSFEAFLSNGSCTLQNLTLRLCFHVFSTRVFDTTTRPFFRKPQERLWQNTNPRAKPTKRNTCIFQESICFLNKNTPLNKKLVWHKTKTGWWFQISFYFHPDLGNIPSLTNIFQMGWNHQLEDHFVLSPKNTSKTTGDVKTKLRSCHLKISASCGTIGFRWYLGEQKSAEFLRFPHGYLEGCGEWMESGKNHFKNCLTIFCFVNHVVYPDVQRKKPLLFRSILKISLLKPSGAGFVGFFFLRLKIRYWKVNCPATGSIPFPIRVGLMVPIPSQKTIGIVGEKSIS